MFDTFMAIILAIFGVVVTLAQIAFVILLVIAVFKIVF